MLFVNLDKEIEEVETRMKASQPNPEDTRDLDYVTGLKRARKILDTELADIKINTDIDPKQAIRLLELGIERVKGKLEGYKKRIDRQITTIEKLRDNSLKVFQLDITKHAGKIMQVQEWFSDFTAESKFFPGEKATMMMTNAGLSVFVAGELFVIPELFLLEYICDMHKIGAVELG